MAKKKLTKQEEEFLAAARKSAALPGYEQRKKAQKAFDNLPKDSPYKNVKFEGQTKRARRLWE